ncbi:MAG: cell wall hydrolase [Clostridia bacterium]|nr:cell wall hydrolase [Clostridia bacterium]
MNMIYPCAAIKKRWRPRLLPGAFIAVLLLASLLMLSIPAANAASYAQVPITQDGKSILGGQAYLIDGVTYVPFRAFCELQGSGTIRWDAQARAAYATTADGVTVCAFADGALYIRYGERYFYTVTPVRLVHDRVYIPIRPLAKCFGLNVSWDATTRSVSLTGTGATPRSDVGVYESDELYWLARIIQAEAGSEPLTGKIAVGNVVLNRVASPEFPSTVYGVIFDREYGVQFTPTINGTIYNEPSVESVVAARLCLEGYTLSNDILYFFNPSIAHSFWISQNRPYAFRIGNHVFYR